MCVFFVSPILEDIEWCELQSRERVGEREFPAAERIENRGFSNIAQQYLCVLAARTYVLCVSFFAKQK
ncbi:hypothetical protein C4585_01905 [Candidatus Parcubacteria bacterium]|nr:MAG: hypothetical protein C4585_01905 [Candidatus Parcubacteria bacterium]